MTSPTIPQVPMGTRYRKPGSWAAGYHPGTDYPCSTGTTVIAPAAGKVIHAGKYGWGAAYGIQVVGESVVNGRTYRWVTAHMKSVSVRPGETIKRGQRIGVSNNTGRSTGPHVHLEVRHYPYNYGDDVNPAILNIADTQTFPTPKPGTETLFDASFWNIAWEKWFGVPWEKRSAQVKAELIGDDNNKPEASVFGFAEIYDAEQVATIQDALGSNFKRVEGHAGLEFFYDSTLWELERPVKDGGYYSGVQNRYALVVHLVRKQTGQHVAFVVTHAPAKRPDLRIKFGRWLGKLLGQIDGPIVLMGDFNTGKDSLSPRKEIRAEGFRDMREQAAIVNEGQPEFPTKGSSLSDIYTQPSDQTDADVVGGEIDITSPKISDHRRVEARIKVVA
jgi:hypothetical protein